MWQNRLKVCFAVTSTLIVLSGCMQGRGPVANNASQETQMTFKQVNANIDAQLELLAEIKKNGNQIGTKLSSIADELQKTNGILRDCCRDTHETKDGIEPILQQYDIRIKPLIMKTDLIEQELKHLSQAPNNTKPNAISDYLGVLSLITAIVVGAAGFVVVVGGFSIYHSWSESRRTLKEELETKFNPWLKRKEEECAAQIKAVREKYEGEMIQLSSFMLLKFLATIPHEKLKEDEIFPLLTNLTSQPKFTYRKLFNDIKGMNISKTVNDKIDEGLKKMDEGKKN